MKRAHRKKHLVIWIFLAPIMVVTLLAAVMYRPADPVNETLPDLLIEEAN